LKVVNLFRFYGRTGGSIPTVSEVEAACTEILGGGKINGNSLSKSKGLQDTELHYCPGCTHGIIHKLIAEVLEEMGLLDTTIAVCPVGCAVFAGDYFSFDTIEASHGRAPAVATGVKRTHPDQPVFTYQGDGDLASIGTAEIVHAAMREKSLLLFINNATYGMTGGQMAPTTLIGQKATTAVLGPQLKNKQETPFVWAEMLAT